MTKSLRVLLAAQLLVVGAMQVWFVVLTWLLVERSASGAAVGFALVAAAGPRAALMVVGGAIVDRRSPERVLQCAAAAMVALFVVTLAAEVTSTLSIVQLALLAAALGAADAFFFPAAGALVPSLAADSALEAANARVQLVDQVTQVAGPILAGALLADGESWGPIAAAVGLALAGALTAGMLRPRRTATAASTATSTHPVRSSCATPATPVAGGSARADIAAGLRHAWTDPVTRRCMLVVAGMNLAAVGPVVVGGAILAESRLGGPAAFGVLLAGFGAGGFGGALLAGRLAPRLRGSLDRVLAAMCLAVGVGLVALGVAPSLAVAVGVAVVIGAVAAYGIVVASTAVQRAAPASMQGRIASLLLFAAFAVDPISQALSGLLVTLGPTVLFALAGAGPIVGGLALLRRPGTHPPRP